MTHDCRPLPDLVTVAPAAAAGPGSAGGQLMVKMHGGFQAEKEKKIQFSLTIKKCAPDSADYHGISIAGADP
jgi:hypothetical protein